jgi:putative ABC transport system permease protein
LAHPTRGGRQVPFRPDGYVLSKTFGPVIIVTSDLRYAFRTIRTRPGFAAAVVGTLALGIGASTAMFSIVDAALLRRIPFDDPDRMVVLWGVAGPEKAIRGASIPEANDWRTRNRSLTDLTLYDETSINLRTADGAERIEAEMVSPSFFPLLGARAALGRTFLPDEDRVPDANAVVVVSDDFWRTRLGADPGFIGRTITLNDRPFTVVGVMPRGFKGLSFDTDLWFPTMLVSLTNGAGAVAERGQRWLMTFGRLRPGMTIEDAQRDLDGVAAQLTAEFPQSNTDRGVQVISLKESYLGTTQTLLAVLFASVIVFLLIACANVTGLQLVRATARRREIAVRLALGANRTRLVRQLMTEGMILALLGGAAGTLVAYWTVDALRPFIPPGLLPGYVNVALDGRVLGFSLLLAVTAGMVCGLAPAFVSARQDLTDALKDGSRSASTGLGRIRRPGLQQVLVGVEVALALMLLVGAGLMVRTLRSQLSVSPGFTPEGVVTARLSLPPRYDADQRAVFATRLQEQLAALPGVTSATVSSDLPLSGAASAATFTLPGATQSIRYYRHYVTPDFFSTLGIPIVRGRAFLPSDIRTAPHVVVLSEAAARRLFPGVDPVGRTLPLRTATVTEATIIGVARDARFRDLTTDITAPASEPDLFFPFVQRTSADMMVAVRSQTASLVSAQRLRQTVAALDPTVPLFRVRPLSELLEQQTTTARFGSVLLIVFSSVALLLAAIGLYGVIAFVVGLSRREIAIRMALGAEARAVRRLVVRNAMMLVAAGVVTGLIAAGLAAGVLANQLFGVAPRDPLTFSIVPLAVLAVAFLASYLPARRAAHVEPQLALKAE